MRIWKIGWGPYNGKDYSLVKVDGPLLEPKEVVECVEKYHYDAYHRLQEMHDRGLNVKVWTDSGSWNGFIGGNAYNGWLNRVWDTSLTGLVDKLWREAITKYPELFKGGT